MKLIDNETKTVITEIELKYTPRISEHIKFESSIYKVNQLEYNEKGINIYVTKTNNEVFFF
jgi:hypothetical protein